VSGGEAGRFLAAAMLDLSAPWRSRRCVRARRLTYDASMLARRRSPSAR